jgi:hypothetical protein
MKRLISIALAAAVTGTGLAAPAHGDPQEPFDILGKNGAETGLSTARAMQTHSSPRFHSRFSDGSAALRSSPSQPSL